MTGGPRRSDDDLTVFDAPAPEDASLSASSSGSRRTRRPPRGVGVAAAALVLLVAGIAVGSIPKPDASKPIGPSSSLDVAASVVPTTPPPCPTPAAGDPGLALGQVRGGLSVPGTFGYRYDAAVSTPDPTQTWPTPPLEEALRAPALADLVLAVSDGACLRSVVLTYLPTGSPSDGPLPDTSTTYLPPLQSGAVGGPPDGDWLLRVQAHLLVPGDLAVSSDPVVVTYFRVLAGSGATASGPFGSGALPTAIVTPAEPCQTGSPDAAVAVVLRGGSGDPVPGADVDVEAAPAPGDASPAIPPSVPLVEVALGDPVTMAVDGQACAVSWDIEFVDPATGLGNTGEKVANPGDDRSFAAQNRWELGLPGPDQLLVAHLHFAQGPTIVRSWRVVVLPFPVPAASLVGKDGSRFQATPGCGLSLSLANGYASDDSCGGAGYEPTVAALRVEAWQPVTFEIPGWSLQSWNGQCGSISTDELATFRVVDGCSLGTAVSDDGQPLSTPSVFLIPPGDHIVALFVTALDGDGNQFSVTYFARVIAR